MTQIAGAEIAVAETCAGAFGIAEISGHRGRTTNTNHAFGARGQQSLSGIDDFNRHPRHDMAHRTGYLGHHVGGSGGDGGGLRCSVEEYQIGAKSRTHPFGQRFVQRTAG